MAFTSHKTGSGLLSTSQHISLFMFGIERESLDSEEAPEPALDNLYPWPPDLDWDNENDAFLQTGAPARTLSKDDDGFLDRVIFSENAFFHSASVEDPYFSQEPSFQSPLLGNGGNISQRFQNQIPVVPPEVSSPASQFELVPAISAKEEQDPVVDEGKSVSELEYAELPSPDFCSAFLQCQDEDLGALSSKQEERDPVDKVDLQAGIVHNSTTAICQKQGALTIHASEFGLPQEHIDSSRRDVQKPPTTRNISLQDLKAVFHLERPQAEKVLRLKRTTFSNLSRHYGISKWPFRTIRDAYNRMNANNTLLRGGSISKDRRRKITEQQRLLHGVVRLIYSEPRESRDSNTLAVLLKIVEARERGKVSELSSL